jgi:histone H3/H4
LNQSPKVNNLTYLWFYLQQEGKVQAVEPDEGKIREIAEAVLKSVASKHWDSVTASTLSAISEDNLKRLIRESLSADSQILKTLYENHIRSHVTLEATKTAAEVASHLIAEAASTIAGDAATKTTEEKPVETKPKEQTQPNVAPNYASFSKEEIVKLVSEQMEKYLLGGVAMPDFALRKAGAAVVPHLTQSRHFPTAPESGAFKKLLASIIPPSPRSGPEEALKPVLTASDCWPFYGGSANLTVELACPVKPTHITIDHIHHKLTPHSSSAPKSFKVYSLSAVNGPSPKKQLLGHYTYQKDTNENVQTFPVTYPADSFVPFVTLEVEDNWGHWYTCLYRFRVHGEPSDACKSKI